MWTCISVYITWHFATFALEIYTYSMTYQLNSVNNACLMELWAKTGLYTFLWKSCISIRISSLYIISPFDNCYSGSMIWRSWQTHDIFAAFFWLRYGQIFVPKSPVRIRSPTHLVIHRDLKTAVDRLLEGGDTMVEERWLEDGQWLSSTWGDSCIVKEKIQRSIVNLVFLAIQIWS